MTDEIVEINCLGLKCPLPVLRLERAFRAGQSRIRLIADDPVSVIDIPLALKNWNATLLAQSRKGEVYEFDILKESP